MRLQCPGCLSILDLDHEAEKKKVLLKCPQCLYVFLARPETEPGKEEPEEGEVKGEATVLFSEAPPKSDAREFQWNRPGASITIIEGDDQGIHKKLSEGPITIGRRGGLAIDDKSMSREHCIIEKRDDGWWVKDLDSLNGTWVNQEKVEEEKLAHLDEIKVGRTRILFAEAGGPSELSLENREDEQSSEIDQTKVDRASREPEIPLPEGREFYFEFMTGPKKARFVKLEKAREIVGRGEEADIRLDDHGVSRKHVMIETHSREHVYISDLASQNGTWLNGMRIRTTRLIHGDLVRMGGSVLKFIVHDTP